MTCRTARSYAPRTPSAARRQGYPPAPAPTGIRPNTTRLRECRRWIRGKDDGSAVR
jgi:hypothetical protein